MSTKTPDQQNVILDNILMGRRSHRQFKQEFPPEGDIKEIIRAGLHAPFAAAAVNGTEDYFRRFFVMKNGSKSMITAASFIFKEVVEMASNLERDMGEDPQLRIQASGFANRLAMIKKWDRSPESVRLPTS